jgi:nucleolar protein 6
MLSDPIQYPKLISFKLTKFSPNSAGGGGKNYNRMEKLRVKNERLAEQRRRKAEVAAKQRERREAKKAAQDTEGAEKEGVAEEKEDQFDMHPSRRAQLQGY